MRSLVDIIFWCVDKTPVTLRVGVGLTIGWLLQHVVRFRHATIADQLQLAFPDLTARERRDILGGVYRHLGLLVIELLALPNMSAKRLLETCRLIGVENVTAALDKGKGVFVLAGHLGNWELGLVAAAQLGVPTHVIVKEIKGAVGQYMATRLREPHGVKTIPRRNSLRQIRHALRAGAVVGFVLDQNMTSDEGVFVDFFGHPACTMEGLALLSQRYGVPVVPVLFRRAADLIHHEIILLPELKWEPVGPSLSDNVRHNTQRYTSVLEEAIRACPEQWLWIHRRWRTQPEPAPVPATTRQLQE